MRSADFARLEAFVAVAERGGFTKAAGALGLTTSTVSHTIKTLEDQLGVRLLNRTTRSVTLTEAGEHLLARASPALAELASALGALDDFREEPQGKLKLSVASLGLSMVIAPILRSFTQAYPAITLEITVQDKDGDLDGVDAGIRSLHRIPKDMISLRIGPESRRIAVASPDYLRRRGRPATPAALAGHTCLEFRFANGAPYRWEFEDAGRKIEVPVAGAVVTDNMDLVLRAAVDGVGIGYTVETHARPFLADGLLEIVLEDYAAPFPGWFLYYPSRRHVPGPLKVLSAFLKQPEVREGLAEGRTPDCSTPSNSLRENPGITLTALGT
jgi:DNA-binding transcriptional LysR family regulator